MTAAGRLPRVAFFTPLPPVQSGISQYSAELLPLLARAVAIDVYVDGYTPTVPVAGVTVLPARRFEANQRARPYDAIVYQMGNSPAHAYMWPLVTRHPGVLVLHDHVLHHLNIWMAVNRRGVKPYLAEMTARYGAAGAAVARDTLRGKMPPTIFDYPLCEALVEASPVVAVHSAYAARLVADRCARNDIEIIPMGVPLYQLPDRAAARARLGLPPDAPVVASLGHASPPKRLDVALRAFLSVRARHPTAIFVVAGAESPGLNLDRQARMLGLEAAVRRLGYIAEETVPDLLAAADVVVNLRFPTAGETSASLLRILAAGQAVIVSRAGSMAEIPPEACVAIAPDAVEEEVLTAALLRLLADAALRDTLAANARAFIERAHTLDRAAQANLSLLARALGRPIPAPGWSPVIVDARAGGPNLASPPAAASPPPPPPHPLADTVAAAITDLGLDRAPGPTAAAARALVELKAMSNEQ